MRISRKFFIELFKNIFKNTEISKLLKIPKLSGTQFQLERGINLSDRQKFERPKTIRSLQKINASR